MKILFQTRLLALMFVFFSFIQSNIAQGNSIPLHHIIFHVIGNAHQSCDPENPPLSYSVDIKMEAANLSLPAISDCSSFRIAVVYPYYYGDVYVGLSEELEFSLESGWTNEQYPENNCIGDDKFDIYTLSTTIHLDFSNIPCQEGQTYVASQALEVQLVEPELGSDDEYSPYLDFSCINTVFPYECFLHVDATSIKETYNFCHACNTGIPPDPNFDPSTNLTIDNNPNQLSNETNVQQKLDTGDPQVHSFQYSTNLQNQTKVYPNPFSNRLFVEYASEQDNAIQLVITDLNGKTLLVNKLFADKGVNQFSLDTTDLPNGIYFLSITDGQQTQSRKIIK